MLHAGNKKIIGVQWDEDLSIPSESDMWWSEGVSTVTESDNSSVFLVLDEVHWEPGQWAPRIPTSRQHHAHPPQWCPHDHHPVPALQTSGHEAGPHGSRDQHHAHHRAQDLQPRDAQQRDRLWGEAGLYSQHSLAQWSAEALEPGVQGRGAVQPGAVQPDHGLRVHRGHDQPPGGRDQRVHVQHVQAQHEWLQRELPEQWHTR